MYNIFIWNIQPQPNFIALTVIFVTPVLIRSLPVLGALHGLTSYSFALHQTPPLKIVLLSMSIIVAGVSDDSELLGYQNLHTRTRTAPTRLKLCPLMLWALLVFDTTAHTIHCQMFFKHHADLCTILQRRVQYFLTDRLCPTL